MRLQAWGDLMRRYGRIFSASWSRRKELDSPPRQAHEHQFLPSALALQETPVHPAPRVAMWLVLLFALIAVAWAILGRIDVVAVARGKIIPDGRTKTIQALETSVVKGINVRDGQRVRPGEVLLELDATASHADVRRLSEDELTARLDTARANALLASLDKPDVAPSLQVTGNVPAGRVQSERLLLEGHYRQFHAQLRQMEAEVERRRQEVHVIEAAVSKLAQTLPIANRRAGDYKKLAAAGHVSQHAYLELEQARIEQSRELVAQKAQLAEAKAALNEAVRQKDAYVAQTRRETLDTLHEARAKAASLKQELIKAELSDRLMRLRSPVAGTVQQLVVHTVGGVVTPAQSLMIVVPRDNVMEVEAMLPNKDIGFVHAGQSVQVKIDTFPYTKYGTIPGVVTHVSEDAIQDEKLGLVYAMRVRLERETIRVNKRSIHLTPGMAVSVEVKTGRRRVVEYFLAPLLQYSSESLHER